jgi:hypothetical protein
VTNEKTFHSLRRGRSPASGDAPVGYRLCGALVPFDDRFVVTLDLRSGLLDWSSNAAVNERFSRWYENHGGDDGLSGHV